MLRISRATWAAALGSVTLVLGGLGCQVLFDIEEKKFPTASGGVGGAGSAASSGSTVSSTGSGDCMSGSTGSMGASSSGAMPLPPCNMGPMPCPPGSCPPSMLARIDGRRIFRAATNGSAIYFPSVDDMVGRSQLHVATFDGWLIPTPLLKKEIEGYIYVLAVDCNQAYFATRRNELSIKEKMWRAPLVGGDPLEIPPPSGEMEIHDVQTIVHDTTRVLWTDSNGLGMWSKVAQGSKRVSYTPGFRGTGLAIQGADVYWAEVSSDETMGKIRHGVLDMMGMTVDPANVISYMGYPGQLGVDAARVYWIDRPLAPNGQSSIQAAPRTLNLSMKVVLHQAPMDKTLSDTIVVDDALGDLFFIEGDGSSADTTRMGKGMGDQPQPLITESYNEQWLLGDNARIYAVTPKDGFCPEFGRIDWVGR